MGSGATTDSCEGKAFYWREVKTLWEVRGLGGQGRVHFKRIDHESTLVVPDALTSCVVCRLIIGSRNGTDWSWPESKQAFLLIPYSPEVCCYSVGMLLTNMPTFPDTHPIHSAWLLRSNAQRALQIGIPIDAFEIPRLSLISGKQADSITRWICVS